VAGEMLPASQPCVHGRDGCLILIPEMAAEKVGGSRRGRRRSQGRCHRVGDGDEGQGQRRGHRWRHRGQRRGRGRGWQWLWCGVKGGGRGTEGGGVDGMA
jgi:hypothetical protein